MSALLQLALLSGVALCLAILLQRAGVNNSNSNNDNKAQGSAGHFPPMIHRKAAPEPARGSGGHFSRAHNPEAIARAKGGTTAGSKSNLAGQIIPVYGFGILLYILYIIFKITSKGKMTKPHENRIPTVRSENMKRKITDFELTQLQERLKETEEVMERIVSKAQAQSPESVGPVNADQEEALLRQLREITRVMHEGRLMDGISPDQEAIDPHYDQDLEDYPEWHQHCCRHRFHQTSTFQHGEMDGQTDGDMDRQMDGQTDGEMNERMDVEMDEDRGVRCADGGNLPDLESIHQDFDDQVYSEEDGIVGRCDEEEELAGEMMMKDMEAFSAYEAAESKTLQKLCWNTEDGLVRRKIKAVE